MLRSLRRYMSAESQRHHTIDLLDERLDLERDNNTYGQHEARIGPDHTCRIRLLQRRPASFCVKPVRIRPGWPGQVVAKRIWFGSKPVCNDHWARFWQNATGPLPFPHFPTRLRSKQRWISTEGLRVRRSFSCVENCFVKRCPKFCKKGVV